MINMNLRVLRKRCKLTQEEVAEKIGVSRQAVQKWEAGESVPDLHTGAALAKLYNVTLETLVQDVDEAQAQKLPPKGKHIFGFVTVGERGQIVIPKKARAVFHIEAGDLLLVLGDEEQGIAIVKGDAILDFAKAILKTGKAGETDDGD